MTPVSCCESIAKNSKERSGNTMVRLKQLAKELGADKTTILKAVKKLGIDRVSIVAEDHGQQETAFTDDDAARIRKHYAHRIT